MKIFKINKNLMKNVKNFAGSYKKLNIFKKKSKNSGLLKKVFKYLKIKIYYKSQIYFSQN